MRIRVIVTILKRLILCIIFRYLPKSQPSWMKIYRVFSQNTSLHIHLHNFLQTIPLCRIGLQATVCLLRVVWRWTLLLWNVMHKHSYMHMNVDVSILPNVAVSKCLITLNSTTCAANIHLHNWYFRSISANCGFMCTNARWSSWWS